MGRWTDRGDLYLFAFRRRHPWRFAALAFFGGVGIATIVADVGAATGWLTINDPTLFRYVIAAGMAAPALLDALLGRSQRRAAAPRIESSPARVAEQ